MLRDKVLFGSDYPLITPERWLEDFAELGIDRRAAARRSSRTTPPGSSGSPDRSYDVAPDHAREEA